MQAIDLQIHVINLISYSIKLIYDSIDTQLNFIKQSFLLVTLTNIDRVW